MSARRFWAVFKLELQRTLKRPMLWVLVGVVGLLAWQMSTGTVKLGTGTAFVGGKKAWITSEFSNAFIFSVLAASFYSFFVAVISGLSIIRDDEVKVRELLHSTPLTSSEYAWGKMLGGLAAISIVLGIQIVLMILFNHVVPNPAAALIQGPFRLVQYIRPALFFALPTIVFFAGAAFLIGVRWRRPGLVFLLPIGSLLLQFGLLWNWSPTWLSPRINKLLMFFDLSGFRWLNETWLKLDRGSDFYNVQAVELGALGSLNRLVVLALGISAVFLAQRYLSKSLFVARVASKKRQRREPPAAGTSLPTVRMEIKPFRRSVLDFARTDIAALLHEPGLYVFSFFVLVQSLSQSLLTVGAFQTPLLMTSGQYAMGNFNTMSLLVCLLLMFFLVESLVRDRSTGLEPLIFSSPASTTAYLTGKCLSIGAIALMILSAAFSAGAITMIIQGQLSVELAPFIIVWGLLLLPTFLAWSAFVAAIQALFDSRYITYSCGIGVLTLSVYKQLTEELNWVGNWLMWDAVRWSDISTLELDRSAIVLNRIMVLGLAALFIAIAVRSLRRRRPDATQVMHRLAPKSMLKTAGRLSPFLTVPLVAGIMLWVAILNGHEGEAAERLGKEYWQQNLNTWKDKPQPSLVAVDLELRLEPEASSFQVKGSYELLNHHDVSLPEFALTAGNHWEDLTWNLASSGSEAVPYEPENRSQLFVFKPTEPLQPGHRITIGFEHWGRHPAGLSMNGGSAAEFILPSGVVLRNYSTGFVPVIGYADDVGVDDDNRAEPPTYSDDRYRDELKPLFGNQRPFSTRIEVTLPEEFTVNSVGRLVHETVKDGLRTALWVSDHPVRLFNVVAGRWNVKRGVGTAIYYHPEHSYNIEEMSLTLEAARRYYSEWFGPYPWAELKLSEFPALADYAQGFPSNITFSESLGFLTRSDPKANAVLFVTAHETAHQWWGNLLTPGDGPGGGLLSEGMANFATALLFEQLEGEAARSEFMKRAEERYGRRRSEDSERPLVKIDGERRGDSTVTYDKGCWVFWMMMREIGRDNMLTGLQEFLSDWQHGPDYPLLEDFVESMRPFATDVERFDDFVEQWFFEVILPEYRIEDSSVVKTDTGWQVDLTVENRGSGHVPVKVAVVTGDRFDRAGTQSADYRSSDTMVVLGPGESQSLRIRCDFKPERVVIDPDLEVLQLRRSAAQVEV